MMVRHINVDVFDLSDLGAGSKIKVDITTQPESLGEGLWEGGRSLELEAEGEGTKEEILTLLTDGLARLERPL